MVSPDARAAVVRLLSFAGIELLDEPSPAPGGDGRLPGERNRSLAQPRAEVNFTVSAPTRVGEPSRVTVSDRGRVVRLSYGTASGVIRIDQFADLGGPFLAKFIDPRNADDVRVDGGHGYWIRRPHDIAYVDRDGQVQDETVRLAARTLLFQRGEVTIRLEGAQTRDEAVSLAETFEP